MARKWLKGLAVVLAVILFLITALILFLHTSWGKSIVRNKVEKYLANKLQTTLSFGAIDYRLPNWIRLKDVLILDRNNDTLLSGGNIYVRINMLKLLSQDVQIGGLEFERIVAHLRREAGDSTFNYQFISEAFTTDSEEADTTTSRSEPIRLSVHHLLLNDIRFTYNDKNEKQYFSAAIGHLYCSPHQLNLEKNIFDIDDLVTKGCYVAIIDSTIKNDKPFAKETTVINGNSTSQDRPAISLALKKLGLRDIHLSYKKPSDKLDLGLTLDTMQVDDALLDLATRTATTQNIFVSNTSIIAFVSTGAVRSGQQKAVTSVEPVNNWKIGIGKIALDNNSVVYHNTARPVKKGFDYNHLEAKQVNFFASQNKTDETGFNADVDSCSLMVNDQLHLKGLKTRISYANSLLLIKDLAFAINQSHLTTSGELAWELKPRSHNENFRCRIDNSVISYADVLSFEPLLSKTLPISFPSSGKVTVSGDLVGSLQNLTVKDLKVYTGNKDFQFTGNATIRNHSGKDNLNYTASVKELRIRKQLLSADLLRRLEKENVQLPDALLLTGQLKGTTTTMDADLKLSSDFGQMDIKGEVSNITDIDRLKYDFVLDARDFATGRWISRDSVLGPVTGKIGVKGNGIHPNKMAALYNLQLTSFMMNTYTYSNIDLSGELDASAFTAKGQINDPNLNLEIDINGKLSDEYPDVAGQIAITKADLRALRLSTDSLALSSLISIDARNEGTGRIVATIVADRNILYINGEKIVVDSLSLTGCSGRDSSFVIIESPFLNAGLNTNYSLTQLPDEINRLRTRVYPKSTQENIIDGRHWTAVKATLEHHALLTTLIPGLKLLQPLTITGKFDAGKKDSFLIFKATTPAIGYNKLNIDQLLVSAEGIDSTTTLKVTAGYIRSGSDSLMQPFVSARLQHDLVTFTANVKDSKGEEFYSAKASARFTKDSTVIRLSDPITFNRNKWTVSADNRVVMVNHGYLVNNLSLAKKRVLGIYAKRRPMNPGARNFGINSDTSPPNRQLLFCCSESFTATSKEPVALSDRISAP